MEAAIGQFLTTPLAPPCYTSAATRSSRTAPERTNSVSLSHQTSPSHTLLDTRGVDHDFLITTSSEEHQTKSRLPHRTVSDELSSLWGSVSRLLHHDDSLDKGTWIWGRRDVGARSMEDTQAPDFCSLGANPETNPLCWWFRPFAVS